MKRTFEVTTTVTIVIDVDDRVLKRGQSKSFSKSFYKFDSAEKVAAHIARNYVLNSARLSNLDGFADLPNQLVNLHDVDDESEARLLNPVRIPAERKTSK